MTLDEVREATAEAVEAFEQLAAHLVRLCSRIGTSFPLSGDVLSTWEDEPRERLHAMLRMVEQLHDLAARKLFRGALFLSGEDAASLSARNLFRRLEALGAIESADRWLALSTTRNLLIHDYPTNPAAQAERANAAWNRIPDLLATGRQTIAFLRREALI